MTKYYIAKFEDGSVIKRRTASRTYTTAWACALHLNGKPCSPLGSIYSTGWAGRPDLAEKAARTEANYFASLDADHSWYGCTPTTQFATAVEVTAKEFRAAEARLHFPGDLA